MKRVAVNVSGPKINQRDVYEGVILKDLASNLSSYNIEAFRDFWAFRDKQAISSADLDMRSNVIVADTINGKRLGRDHPFCFIARNNRGDLVVVRNLAYVRLAGTP
jgi:hypothetical protein